MISKEIKDKIMNETDLDKVLEILKPYKGQDWDDEIMEHIQKITPEDEHPIGEFSYIRPNKK